MYHFFGILIIIYIFVKIKITMTMFDINKLIRIDLKSCKTKEIFIIARYHELNFENILNLKNDNFDQIYVQVTDGSVVAYVKGDLFKVIDKYTQSITRKVYKKLHALELCKVPKLINEDAILENYLYYLEKGYDIRIPSLDKRIEELRNKSKVQPIKVETIKVETIKVEKEIFNVDEILDKINESGIESITKEEKKFLDNLYS